jgi:DNA-binding NtrC family response regulator
MPCGIINATIDNNSLYREYCPLYIFPLFKKERRQGVILLNILVVDNEIVQADNLRIGLISRGHHVLHALNGQQALHLIDNDALEIDLVITDYAMPEINGIKLLQSIRWLHGSLPVILTTAYGQRDIVVDALRNQCNGFIDKPFTLDQLLHEIERVMATIDHNTAIDISRRLRQNEQLPPVDIMNKL